MSYKKRQLQKSKFNQFKYKFGQIKLALLKRVRVLFQRGGRMRLIQTSIIMDFLRARNKTVSPNNQKIDEWVDTYINQSILNEKKVDILTQWCLSKDLETRYKAQGDRFVPLQTELNLFQKQIPEIVELFTRNGAQVNWWVTFNGSFLERGRVSDDIANQYMEVIREICQLENLIFLDWEKDILGKRPEPNEQVLNNCFSFVAKKAFDIDFQNLLTRVRKYPDFKKTEEELRRESIYKIACEAEEGRFLFSPDSPFPCGQFIMIPMEFPERYIFFSALVPEFKKRIVSVVKLYPWRMDAQDLQYEL